MYGWAEEMLSLVPRETHEHERTVFTRIETAARALGYEHCAYGLQLPLPLTRPKVVMLNNYSAAWRGRYESERYLDVDPVVRHGRKSTTPYTWNSGNESPAPGFWDDARAHGLAFGWAQSCRDSYGLGGMLTLARAAEPISEGELKQNEVKLRWLTNVAHLSLACALKGHMGTHDNITLTQREVEVMKWQADGKTLNEISDILLISVDTVKFHTRNAMLKLHAPNKTAAVVRAAVLGLLC